MKKLKPVVIRSFNDVVLGLAVGQRAELIDYKITRIPNGWIYESITANTTPFLLFVPESLPCPDSGTIYSPTH